MKLKSIFYKGNNMKLKNILSERKLTEKMIMDNPKMDSIARDIVLKYFASKHDPRLISNIENGKEQNKLLSNLQSAIKGAIKSVITNYKGIYHTQDREDTFKK